MWHDTAFKLIFFNAAQYEFAIFAMHMHKYCMYLTLQEVTKAVFLSSFPTVISRIPRSAAFITTFPRSVIPHGNGSVTETVIQKAAPVSSVNNVYIT